VDPKPGMKKDKKERLIAAYCDSVGANVIPWEFGAESKQPVQKCSTLSTTLTGILPNTYSTYSTNYSQAGTLTT